ncbi:MAG: chemotaxis protein CheA, partial [Thermoplasmata archaeon]
DTEGEDGSDIYEEELSEIEKTKVIEAISEDRNVFALKVNFAKDLKFKEGRAFQLLRNLSTIGNVIYSSPENVTDDVLKFKVIVSTKSKGVELESIAMEVTGITNAVAEPIIVCNSKNIETESKVMKTQNGISESKPTEINNLSRDVARADTIRVKSKLLDHLLNLVGEIMISNIRLNQIALELKNKELKQVIKNNIRLMNLLQDTVLQMRLVPIETIFKRYPKMVRDMAKETGKEIEFIMVGNEIEIDRSLLDSIGDSLVHLLRNAVDHGIEHDREKIGKPKKGVVKLSALQEKNSIVITVEDDGRGIDIKKIKEKAVEKGLISKDESERIDDKTALWLAFHPGISTSTTVTEYSGRGVGLDVVKTKVESLGGSIKVETKPGLGTKFIIKLPPSMSIIPAMLVEINGECYAIPLENVKETTKIACDKIIEYDKNRMFKLRDEVLPLVNIHEEFGGKPIDTKEL